MIFRAPLSIGLNRIWSWTRQGLPCCLTLLGLASAFADAKPNVLFIAIDDLRPELGCYGIEGVHSPHIDSLASEGVLFNSAHCQLAVCNPSRVSLLTGLRPDSTKVWTLDVRFRNTIPEAITLPQHFKNHGYQSLGFGKIFHNPWPDNVSWSEPHSWPRKSQLWSPEARKELVAFKKSLKEKGTPQKKIDRLRATATEAVDIPDRDHIDGAIAEQALRAMRSLAKQDEPFFLAAGFVRPHLPFVVPQKYWDLYERDQITLANQTAMPRDSPRFAMNTMYELRDYFDYLGTPDPQSGSLTEAQQRELKHGYLASVSFIDAQVGKLLSELEKLELVENTIVILWSDHGFKLGEHNSWCKQSNYEIDTRVPLIIHDPRRKGNGASSDSLVELVDIYPTLCDLAGLPIADNLEGTSLKPILDNPEAEVKDAAVSQFLRRQNRRELMGYAYRNKNWRYVEWVDRSNGKTVDRELYDHRTDSNERTNVVSNPENEQVCKQLGKELRTTQPLPLGQAHRANSDSPNIVVIMGDDWSWPHASILGDKTVRTPTFDRIAKEGVLFENAFTPAPSCTPSRHSASTGQYHWRLGGGVNLGGSIEKGVPTYPDMLANAGYFTGFSRKGTAPSKHSFRGNDPFGERYKNFNEFIDARKDDQPFCFWYGAGEPHRAYDWQASLDSDLNLDSIAVPPYLPDNTITQTDLGDYYLKVEKLDQFAGEIIAKLEQAGELENTIVVITSDNGMPFPRAKANLYDAGIRVPLAIRWGKNIKGSRKISDFVSLTDLAPTFLEAVGIPVPEAMTGRSLLSSLSSEESGQIDPDRNFVLAGMEQHVYPNPSRAIRTQDYLYIRNFAPESWPTGKVAGDEPTFDFKETPWPTVPGAFSHNIDPGPTKQWMRHNDSPQDTQAFGKRPAEELYRINEDSHQLNNLLAGRTTPEEIAEIREKLSRELTEKLRASRDPRFTEPDHVTFSVRGWTIHLNDELWADSGDATRRMLAILDGQLQRVINVVPKPALQQLREIPIWINPTYSGKRGTAEYHPGKGWLVDNGRNPKMTKAIEITNVNRFPFENRRMPYVLLHELAHGYHDRILSQGYGNAEVKAAFEKARDSGVYNEVDRFTGEKIVKDKAYALSNPMEYFAESTEAYFGKNDFFPFNRKELKENDPHMHDLIQKLWNVPSTKK